MKAPRFVVYHIDSTMEKKSFFLEAPARKLAGQLGPQYAVASIDHYTNQVVHMVTRRNMMSGAQYQEASNTPSYMSPSCETYWSR